MKGVSAMFWMALAAACQALSSYALQVSILLSTSAGKFHEKTR